MSATTEYTHRLAELYPAHLRTLIARTEAAMHHAGIEQLAIHSGLPKVAFQDDYHYPFKPNPNFLQFLPLNAHPFSFIVLRAGHKPRLIFSQPRDYWHVVPANPSGYWVEHFDIVIIRDAAQARHHLDFSLRTAFVGEDTTHFADWGFASFNPAALLNPLHWQRAYKTPYEVECIVAANISATRAHKAAEAAFNNGAAEFDIHMNYLRAAKHAEHEMPYGNIIALNQHGAVLHYTDLDRAAPTERHSFLIDAGAQCFGYAADITRTYSARNDEFAKLIVAMDRMELDLVASIKPGMPYLDVHLAAHRGVAQILADFSFVQLPVDEIVSSGISSVFFPHGIGHLLGLQVHDIAGRFLDASGTPNPPPAAHPYLRLTRKIETDMVFTIEPGLYFIDMLLDELKQKPQNSAVNWAKIESFKHFGGIRIEDNVLVTANGTRNITREAFAIA